MIGIFAQTREEVATLLENVEVLNRRTIGSMRIYKVTYNENTFYIITTGVGKVNAAFALSYAINKLCIDKVIVAGNAASLIPETAPIGTVAIATSSLQWDVNFINLGYPANVIPGNNVSNYPTDAALLRNAVTASNGLGYPTFTGVFASGDTFVASAAQADQINTATGADFLDIETGAIGQISYQMNIPYISVKGISNYANEDALTDYNANRVAANNLSNRVVLEMLDTLFEERINQCEEDNMNNNTTTTANTANTVIACPCNCGCNACNQWGFFNGCNSCNTWFNNNRCCRNNFWGFFW